MSDKKDIAKAFITSRDSYHSGLSKLMSLYRDLSQLEINEDNGPEIAAKLFSEMKDAVKGIASGTGFTFDGKLYDSDQPPWILSFILDFPEDTGDNDEVPDVISALLFWLTDLRPRDLCRFVFSLFTDESGKFKRVLPFWDVLNIALSENAKIMTGAAENSCDARSLSQAAKTDDFAKDLIRWAAIRLKYEEAEKPNELLHEVYSALAFSGETVKRAGPTHISFTRDSAICLLAPYLRTVYGIPFEAGVGSGRESATGVLAQTLSEFGENISPGAIRKVIESRRMIEPYETAKKVGEQLGLAVKDLRELITAK